MQEEALDDGPDMYMKKAATFLREVMALARAQKVSTPRVLCELFPMNPDMKASMLQPSASTHQAGYLTFQCLPQGMHKGTCTSPCSPSPPRRGPV